MIKWALHILAFLIFFMWGPVVHAQFINLELKIEPELSAAVEQQLDFGTQITNSGQTEVGLGDVNMGIFSIRAFSNQQVYVELSYPEHLENRISAIKDIIPLQLDISYNNSNVNSFENSRPLTDNKGIINMSGENRLHTGSDLWSILYIYIFGSIDVGNISNGLYTADIVLTVIYE